VEFPGSLGIFNTERFTNLDTLTVHGSSQQSQEVVSHHTGSMQSAGTLLSTPSPTMAQIFRTPARSGWVPSRGQGVRGKGKAACTTIKVVHANRKPDGSAGSNLSQCFLTLNEDSANVPSVTRMIRDHFGDPALILTSSNGLPIPDSSASTGNILCKLSLARQQYVCVFSRCGILVGWNQETVPSCPQSQHTCLQDMASGYRCGRSI
jgi:hypothetical protein